MRENTIDAGEATAGEAEKNIIGSLTLIFIGGVLLLNVLDILPNEVWSKIFRIWPVLLIFHGLKMMLAGSKLGNHLLLVLVAITYVTLGFLVLNSFGVNLKDMVSP